MSGGSFALHIAAENDDKDAEQYIVVSNSSWCLRDERKYFLVVNNTIESVLVVLCSCRCIMFKSQKLLDTLR